MLDINLIRKNPEVVKQSQKKRGLAEGDIDKILKLDKEWRELKEEADNLRSRRNKISEQINQAKKQKKPSNQINQLIEEARKIPQLLAEKESQENQKKQERDEVLRDIPNIIDQSINRN